MKSSSVTIQIKATEQYFPVVLFVILYKVVLTFKSAMDEILNGDHSNESYWYFPVVLFIVLYKVALTVFGVNIQISATEHGTVYYAAQGGSHFWVSE